MENPDWNEEEEDVIVLDDDMDIEEDWLEDSTCAREEDWKEEDEDWFILEDFIAEVFTDWLVWLKPKDSVDSSWKVASCLDSCWMELDWFASEKLMLPPFCYLVKNIGISIEYTSCACQQMWALLMLKYGEKVSSHTGGGWFDYLHFEFPRGSLLDGSIKTHRHHLDAANQILSSDL